MEYAVAATRSELLTPRGVLAASALLTKSTSILWYMYRRSPTPLIALSPGQSFVTFHFGATESKSAQ